MKVAIITRHNIINYGSVLQAIALQEVLRRRGHDVCIIDYLRMDEDYRRIAKVLVNRNSSWNKNCLTRMIFVTGKTIEYLPAGRKFEKIRKEYLNLSDRVYRSCEDLKQNPIEADIYMTGSDQVWGGIGSDSFDSAFFLDFGKTDVRRVSYAASFGRTDYSAAMLENYRDLLARYDAISVREVSAQQIVTRLGYQNVEQVLDPTLLLTSDEWDNLLRKDHIHKVSPRKKYILVYQRRPNKRIDEYAEQLAKKMGVTLYRISTDLHQMVRGGHMVFLPNLREFIEWLRNAQMLVTDSFHGTAFAINYNIPFVDILPEGTSTRNMSILEMTGLTDRVVKSQSDFSCINKAFDFSKANEIIRMERIRSMQILENMLIC